MLKPSGHPQNAGRLSWWLPVPGRFGGSTLCDIAGGNHATLHGSPLWTRGFSSFDAAVALNGSSQYGRAVCPTLTAFTFVAWVRFDNFTGATILKNWGETIAGYLHWDASLAGAGVVRAYVNSTSGGGGNVTAGNTLSTGVAYHLAVTAGGGALALYCNGVSVGTDTYAGNLSSTLGYLGFGCKLGDTASAPDTGPGAAYLAGTMGDVSFWSRALSATEIALEFAEAKSGYPELLVRPRTQVSLLHAAIPPAATVVFAGQPTLSGALAVTAASASGAGWLGVGYSEEDPMSITYGSWSTDSAINAQAVVPGTDLLGSALSLDGTAVAHLSFEFAKSDADGKGGDIILEYLKDRDGTYFETQPGDLNKQVRRCTIPGDGSTGSTTITVYASEGKAIKPRVRVLGTSATVTLRTMTGTA